MTVRILAGHVLDRLAELPDESVHCIVTSPPYWGLRSYGTEPQVWGGDVDCDHSWSDGLRHTGGSGKQGVTSQRAGRSNVEVQERSRDAGAFCQHCGAWCGELGLEPNYQLYVEHIVAVFDELRRVLRCDGVAWLNLGDCYANDGKWGGNTGGKHVSALHGNTSVGRAKRTTGLKPKDLVGIPWRVAFALQDRGWWLRQDNIWHKRAPMPESVEDRTTKAHEYVFQLTKAARYYYDAVAISEPFETDPRENYPSRAKTLGRGEQGFADARGNDRDKSGGFPVSRSGRNRRSVWSVVSTPTPEAHFATMPEEIAEICILAGTSAKGVCTKCGAPWVRVVARQESRGSWHNHDYDTTQGQSQKKNANQMHGDNFRNNYVGPQTIGWSPSCSCGAGVVPAVVLDPFLGSGTTARVADRLARDCIGIELLPKYAAMADRRSREPGFALA